jgi:hypothetical protein
VHLQELWWQSSGDPRDAGYVVATDRDDDLLGDDPATRVVHVEPGAVLAGADRQHGRVLPDGRVERGRKACQPGVQLIPDHEAVGIGTVIGVAGELALPVGGHQAERVPAGIPPVVHEGLPLEHHVLDAVALEVPADTQTRLAAADDDDRDALDLGRHRAAPTIA